MKTNIIERLDYNYRMISNFEEKKKFNFYNPFKLSNLDHWDQKDQKEKEWIVISNYAKVQFSSLIFIICLLWD